MEMRNKDLENAWAVQGIRQEKCAKLEAENKNLNKQIEQFKKGVKAGTKIIERLEEENKKLKEDSKSLESAIGDVVRENRRLKEECEENDYLVEDNARWMKKCEEKIMEIKKLKSDLAYERTMLDNVKAEYKSLQNVIKNLKEENEEYKKMFEAKLKEAYIKNTAEFLDKKFPKVNGFMEEDTLQELRDIGKI